MTTGLKFILGSQELLQSRVRKSAEDHERVFPKKVCRECMAKAMKKNCNYCTHRFSQRTLRDERQTPGELYMGD